MNIRFNEKSFFDEDIQVFDESNFLIAEIIKKRGYFVFLNAIDYNFKLKNEKKEIVLNCLNKVFTNNGTASFKTEIEIIIVLFSILLMTNRRRIFQQKLI